MSADQGTGSSVVFGTSAFNSGVTTNAAEQRSNEKSKF